DPRPDRRRPHQPPDRREDVPRREGGEELRVDDPGEDGHEQPQRSRGLRLPTGSRPEHRHRGVVTRIDAVGERRCMNELTVNRCRRLLESSPVAHLAVISRGEPYVTPISYVMVDDAICIRTMDGRRVEALRENSRVCLTVSHYDEPTGDWES